MVMVLDLMHIHCFYCQLVNEVKMLFFLLRTIAHKAILIIGQKPPSSWGRTNEWLDDTTITAMIEYYVDIHQVQEENLFQSTLQCCQQFFVC